MNLLARYPVLPLNYHERQTEDEAAKSREMLLREALSDHRRTLKTSLDALLQKPGCFVRQSEGTKILLSASERECLLQVLNDIRVGSWWRLGCPGQTDDPDVDEANAEDHWAMDLCGYFQMGFLSADASR